MTDQDRVVEYLIRAGGQSYCDDCLSTALDLSLPRVEQAIGALAEDGFVKRAHGPCATCGKSKLVSKRRTSSFAA